MGTDDIKQAARPGRVTIRMVAAVSKVLHNAYGVSDRLRQNVMVSIERLGYRPSVAARGVRGQTYTIGILLVEIANPFLPMVIDGVNAVLGPSNYQALFGNGKPLMSLDASLIESMIDYRTDGLILIAPRMSGEHLAKFAVQIPIAVIGQHEPTTSNFDTVNVDDFDAAKLAVRTYVARGITDIAMVNLGRNQMDPENVTAVRERGYLAAMHEAGLSDKVRIMRSPLSMAGRDEFIAALLAPANRPHALF